MNNPLLRSGAIVVAFWWLLLTSLSLGDLSNFTAANLSASASKLAVVLLAVVLGVSYPVAYLIRRRKYRLDKLSGTAFRGLSITIGPTPKGLLPPKRLPGSEFVPDEGHPLLEWLAHVQQTRPDIHAVFNAVTEVYAAHMELPAAPVKYGHGGRSLFEHTCVVVDMMMAKAREFAFDGSYSKSGTKTAALLDPHFVFDRSDPMIPLIAYAHDIGKVDAYKMDEKGQVREVLPDHDRPGRLLLARLPEVWGLPKDDREVLFNAVGYYHHPQALPRHVDDRSRALMELLLEADLAAGEWEGKNPLHKGCPVTPGLTVTRSTDWSGSDLEDRQDTREEDDRLASDQSNAENALSERSDTQPAPEISPSATSPAPDTANLDEQEAMLVHHVIDILAMPHSINGSKKPFRIGYKHGNRIYLKEAALCKAVATAIGDPKLATPAARKGDNRSHLTEDVMRSLDKLGLLVVEHDGRRYSHKTALFTVEWYDERAFRPDPPKAISELLLETDPATVILEIRGALAHLGNLKDCRLVPKVVRPLMGVHKAINKPKPGAGADLDTATPAAVAEEIVDKDPEAKVDAEGRVPPNTQEPEIYPPVVFDGSSAPVGKSPDGEMPLQDLPTPSSGITTQAAPTDAVLQSEHPAESPENIRSAPRTQERPHASSPKAPSGMKRRASRSADDGFGSEAILDSIMSLQAAADEKAAARAAKNARSTAAEGHNSPSPRGPIEASPGREAAQETPAVEPQIKTVPLPELPPLGDPPQQTVPTAASVENDSTSAPAPPPIELDPLARVHAAVATLNVPCLERVNSQGVVFLTCPLTPELSSKLEDVLSAISLVPRKDLRVVTEKQTGALHLAFEKKRP